MKLKHILLSITTLIFTLPLTGCTQDEVRHEVANFSGITVAKATCKVFSVAYPQIQNSKLRAAAEEDLKSLTLKLAEVQGNPDLIKAVNYAIENVDNNKVSTIDLYKPIMNECQKSYL